ncbi:MAG: hypothetical protein R2774_07665 [Saprospiraceae bacterium]
MLPTKKQVILFIIIAAAVSSNAQKRLQFSIESGAILPVPIFYKGLDVDSNNDTKITVNPGLSAGFQCKWNYDRKTYLSLGIYYNSYLLNIKEFVLFPIIITPDGIPISERSFLYSNFDVENLDFRTSFGSRLNKKLNLNGGFQIGIPLNEHFGYLFNDFITKFYNYKTKNPFSLFANIEYQWYQSKKLNFTLVPEFSYNLQKDAKTYVHENQIRKMYLALRVGVGFR